MSVPLPSHVGNQDSSASLAVELESLRNHFAPVSFLSGSTDGIERLSASEPLVDRRSPLPLDNSLVRQTKDQIREHVDSVKRLAATAIEPNEFLEIALSQIMQAMGARAAALWEHPSNSTWQVVSQIELPKSLLAGTPSSSHSFETDPYYSNESHNNHQSSFERLDLLQARIDTLNAEELEEQETAKSVRAQASPAHVLILDAVAAERQPILIPPNHVLLNQDRPSNPTTDLLIYAPLQVPGEMGAMWLQVVQAPSGGLSSQRGYLRFVAQMADMLSEYYRTHRLRLFERDRVCLKVAQRVMSDMTLQSQTKLGLARLVNTLREHAKSEHAMLLRRPSRLGRWRVEAAAGLVDVDRRAEGIVQIERVANWIDTHLNANSRSASESLVSRTHDRDQDVVVWTNMFAVTDMAWLKPLSDSTTSKVRPLSQDVAILLMWSQLHKPPADCIEQCNLIARLALSALRISWWQHALSQNQEHPNRWKQWLYPTLWSQSFQACVGILLVLAVAFLPVPIRLHATAILMPTTQQHVYAPIDCVVDEVLVHHGDHVHSGQPLLRLGAAHLAAEYDQTMAQNVRNGQRLKDIESRLLREKNLNGPQRDELEGEREILERTQRIEFRILESLKQQLDSLVISAEIDGVVSTWNIHENLNDRPLRAGQWLLSLHDANSDWVMEAALPEQDGSEFQQAMQTQTDPPIATLQASPQTQIPLKYRMEPNRIERRITTDRDTNPFSSTSDSVIRMRFDVPTKALPVEGITAGAAARVSIPNGRGPLIWALSKDFVRRTWAQLRMWI